MNPPLPAWRLRVWTRFHAPPAEVWRLKTDPAALRRELRPLALRVADPEGLHRALDQGQVGAFAASVAPLGLSWPLEVLEVQPGRFFVERSQNALFHLFEHRHQVEAAADGSRYLDDLLLSPKGPWPLVSVDLVRRFFVRRHRLAARQLPHDPAATAVVVLRQVLEHELATA